MEGYKYLVPISKSYTKDGKRFIGGIASGIALDRDGQRMDKAIFDKFIEAFPLPLTNSHIDLKVPGIVGEELGDVYAGYVTENDEFYIEAELDTDNPDAIYLEKKLAKGKQFAFSIQGDAPKFRMEMDETLGRPVQVFYDVIPTSISVTTKPAYAPSFIEVLSKSIKNINEQVIEKTMDETIITAEAETQTTELAVENTVTTEPTIEETTTAETQPDVATQEVEVIAEETKQEVITETEIAKSVKAPEQNDFMAQMQGMYEAMVKMHDEIKAMNSKQELEKSFLDVQTVLKSIHEDVEALKKTPLEKKSVVMAKSLSERNVPAKPQTTEDLVKNILNLN